MKTTQVLIIALVIIVLQFFLDGLYHAVIAKSLYEVQTASFYYPTAQQKLPVLFLAEIPFFGGMVFFVEKCRRKNSLASAAGLGAFFCFLFGATFVLVNTALMPGWTVDLSISEVGWNTVQGAIAGSILALMAGMFEKRNVATTEPSK